jgi:hypothetical protein
VLFIFIFTIIDVFFLFFFSIPTNAVVTHCRHTFVDINHSGHEPIITLSKSAISRKPIIFRTDVRRRRPLVSGQLEHWFSIFLRPQPSKTLPRPLCVTITLKSSDKLNVFNGDLESLSICNSQQPLSHNDVYENTLPVLSYVLAAHSAPPLSVWESLG